MPRAISLFEGRDILAYNKTQIVSALRYNCVRAKELDEKLGKDNTSDYLLSMLALSNAIRQELGLKPVDKDGGATSESVETDPALQERIEEQEAELEELDEVIEAKDKEIDSLNADAEALSLKIKELEATNKKLTTENKKLTTSTTKKATTKKGGK